MARRRKEDRKTFTSTMKQELHSKLQEESERTGVPVSKLLDRAVDDYLQKQRLAELIKTHPNA